MSIAATTCGGFTVLLRDVVWVTHTAGIAHTGKQGGRVAHGTE